MTTDQLLRIVEAEVRDFGHDRIRAEIGEQPMAAHTPPEGRLALFARLIAKQPISDQLALPSCTGDSFRMFHALPGDEFVELIEEDGVRFAVHHTVVESRSEPTVTEPAELALDALVLGVEAQAGLSADKAALAA